MASAASDTKAPRTTDKVRAIYAAAVALDGFEPFVGRMVDANALNDVVASGLVETGPSCRPAVGEVGYRLTAKGWKAFKRTTQGPVQN